MNFMKHYLAMMLLMFVTFGVGAAEEPRTEPKQTVARSAAIDALKKFQQDPLNNLKAAKTFMTYVKEDGDIHVSMPEPLIPWMQDPNCPGWARAFLLSAFVAGNFDSQLEDSSRLDDTAAGLTYTVEVYDLLKQKHPDLEVEMLDKLLAAKRNDNLARAVDKMVKQTQPGYEDE